MKMMSYGEFETKTIESMKRSGLPQDYIDEVIRRGCIRADYEGCVEVSNLLGTSQFSTDAYGWTLLYPDFPDSYEEYKAKKAKSRGFDFQFQGVRPQTT